MLANPDDHTVPSLSELMDLNLAGLGKKRVKFPSKDANHLQVRETLESVYPKLKTQNGAFEFLRAERGGGVRMYLCLLFHCRQKDMT